MFINIVIIFCVFNISLIAQDIVEIIKEVQPAVVTVLCYDKDDRLVSQGTGFFINKEGHLITNHHVVKDAYRVEIQTYDSRKYFVPNIIGVDEDSDLISLEVSLLGETIHYLNITESIPSVGTRLLVIGSPLGLEQTVTEGIVSAKREIPKYGRIIQITAPISPGSSGSPVVTLNGDVVGVASLTRIGGQNLNFAIPSHEILSIPSIEPITMTEWYEIKRPRDIATREPEVRYNPLSILKGERVRITTDTEIYTGRVAEVHPNVIWMMDEYRIPAQVGLSSIKSIEIPKIKNRTSEGAVWGGIVGGILGIIAGIAIANEERSFAEEFNEEPEYEIAVVAGLAFFGLGIGLGMMAGQSSTYEVWEEIPSDRYLMPQSNVSLNLQYQF